MTSNTMVYQGTQAYTAPEAFHGTLSVKMDIFSFGVVLLELLTGLPAYSPDREGGESLVSYSIFLIFYDIFKFGINLYAIVYKFILNRWIILKK